VQSTLNLNISAPTQNFKNLVKSKNVGKELPYLIALNFSF